MDASMLSLSVSILVLVAVVSLVYWLNRKFAEMNKRFSEVEGRFEGIESALIQFADTLFMTLGSEGALADVGILALRGSASSMIPDSTEYYTEEMREKLLGLLNKDPRDYTIGDTEELERIADLMEEEGFEMKRRDLVRYAWTLRYYAIVVRAVHIYPKLYNKKMGKTSPPRFPENLCGPICLQILSSIIRELLILLRNLPKGFI